MKAEFNISLEDELRQIVREEVVRTLVEVRQSPEWLNAKSAAAYLDTTEDAIRALVRRRQLPAHRSEVGTLRFLRDELDTHARGLE
ncbi:MAG: helix-turn-helix domain-containing protein [Actinobacteria bacterium]|nr:helix-turn-helix domain-containing protein [Actinomycetota bacterium]